MAADSVPEHDVDRHPIVLYDGVCNLCNGAVRFIIDHDRVATFRFAALQSEAAERALAAVNAPEPLPDSVVVIDGRGLHTKSDAALAIARRLPFPWMLFRIAKLIPRFVRDPVYDWVARNRYRWFGHRAECRVPTPEICARFLDAEE